MFVYSRGMSELTIRLRDAERHLSRVDPVIEAQVRGCGPCGIDRYAGGDPLPALVSAIIAQQISVAAANTIEGRLKKALGGRFTARGLLEAGDETLRGAGISPQKVGYLRDLAGHVVRRRLSRKRLESMSDEDATAALMEVKGIGRWTAEIFLMFRLGRLDLLPWDDVGLQAGAQLLYDLPERADKETLQQIAEPWRPYRTIGCWYVWQGRRREAGLPLR